MADAQVANRVAGATPAVRAAGADSVAMTTIAAIHAAVVRRTPEVRGAVDARPPVVAGSAVTGLVAPSVPTVVAVTNGPDRRGRVRVAPIGPVADRVSGPKVHGRVRKRIVPAVRGRSRVPTVTSGSTVRGSAGSPGLRDALPSAIPIVAGTIGVTVPDARMIEAVPRTVVSVGAVRPTALVAVGTIAASVAAVRPTGPIAVRIDPAGTGSIRPEVATVRALSREAVEKPTERDAAAAKAAVAESIDARHGPRNRTCPTRSRPAISIPPFGGIC